MICLFFLLMYLACYLLYPTIMIIKIFSYIGLFISLILSVVGTIVLIIFKRKNYFREYDKKYVTAFFKFLRILLYSDIFFSIIVFIGILIVLFNLPIVRPLN